MCNITLRRHCRVSVFFLETAASEFSLREERGTHEEHRVIASLTEASLLAGSVDPEKNERTNKRGTVL